MNIRTRIPPSPTGLLHIGTVRTALYNHLFTQHYGGTMVFRMEDTDRERSKPEYEKDISDGLQKLGLAGSEGLHVGGPYAPYRQSERTEIYQKHLKELIEKDKAYYCFCSKEKLEEMREKQRAEKKPPRYEGTCADLSKHQAKEKLDAGEKAVIRLRVPNDQNITWRDGVRGETTIHSKEIDDFVIARAINDPLYHLTVVADDHDMEITHVIRGEDHISNTPKQILIYQAFEWKIPIFAHLPLILNDDKSKLSKRKNKVSMDDYLNDGYLPEAIINFLALLGWNTADEQEIFSMEELIEKFTLDRVQKSGAIFDIKKLDWINGEYIKKAIEEDIDVFYKKYESFITAELPTQEESFYKKILKDPDFAGRFKKLTEIPESIAIFVNPVPDYPLELIMNEKFKITAEILQSVIEKAKSVVNSIEWDQGDSSKNEELSQKMVAIVSDLELKNGQVLWPLRVALSGLERSPNFSTLMVYLGKDEVLKRLDFALQKVL